MSNHQTPGQTAATANPEPPPATPERKRTGGPKTPAGKARSAQNATRHGLTSNSSVCLSTEDQAAFDRFRQSLIDEFQPVGALELDLLEEMVLARWRQRRAAATEAAAIDFELAIQADEDPLTETHLPHSTRTARAIRKMHEDSTDLANYSRYETRFHRMYHRALKQLIEIQDRRKTGNPAVTPVTPSEPLPAGPIANFPNELQLDLKRSLAPRLTRAELMDSAIAGAVASVLAKAIPLPQPHPFQAVHLKRTAAASS